MDILFFDVETCGISTKSSTIEIGAIYYKDGVEQNRFQGVCGPIEGSEINIGALAVNRAKLRSMDHRGSPETMVHNFVDFLLELPIERRKGLILAGHNVKFDIDHVDSMMRQFNVVDFTEFTSHRVIDTAAIAQFLIDAGVIGASRAGLGIVAQSLEVDYDPNQHHGALYDAELSAKVYFKMLDLVKKHTGVQHLRPNWG